MNHKELFRVDGLPVFQNKMFSDQAKAIGCSKGNMRLIQDLDTGLIFNAAFDASLLEYDEDYQNEQACSSVFKQHLDDVRSIIQRYFFGKSLIEVGCGKGYFLEYLNQAGYEITGIDPAYEGDNPNVIKACFDKDLGVTAEGIVMRHVLEHMSDPFGFLSAITNANEGKGKIYIEVPCFDWICKHSAWFDIFYEHVNYFRLPDLNRMFGNVVESGKLFGGQYIYIVAELSSIQQPTFNGIPNSKKVEFSADKGVQFSSMVVWGGASKGVIYSLLKIRAGSKIDMVIDINPSKQGKYLPATGLLVSSPKDAMKILLKGSNIFVMNGNYMNEIKDMTEHKFNYIKAE